MDDCRCIFPTIIGIIFGIIIGFLVKFHIITKFLPIVFIALGIVLFAILLLVLIALFGEKREEDCVCEHGRCLVIGAIGTILLALIILAVICGVSTLALAILFGIGGFFFIFTLVSLLELLLCLVDATCFRRE